MIRDVRSSARGRLAWGLWGVVAACGGRAAETPESGHDAARPTNGHGTTQPANGHGTARPADGLPEGLCPREGWCWVEPRPFGDLVNDIHGTPDGSSVFAVGYSGMTVELKDGRWRYHDLGTSLNLHFVYVVAPDDVWASDNGLLHYDGSEWSRSPEGYAGGMDRGADGQLWATLGDRLMRYVDSEWVDMSPNDELHYGDVVTGPGPSELWVITYEFYTREVRGVALMHFDGAEWSQLPGGLDSNGSLPRLVRVGHDVYAYDRLSTWLASGGWQSADVPSAQSMWASEGRLFGSSRAIWGTASEEIWFADASGGVQRHDAAGTELPIFGEPGPHPTRWEEQPWGTVPLRLWAGGPAWASGPNDVWRSGGDVWQSEGDEPLAHFDGVNWTSLPDVPTVLSIDGSAPDNVWFVPATSQVTDSSRLLRWDGSTIHEHVLPEEWSAFGISAIRSFAPDDTWALIHSRDVGYVGHYDGNVWSLRADLEVSGLFGGIALAGSSSSDLWALTRQALHHFDGASWEVALESDGDQFVALAVDDRDVWVLGSQFAYVRAGAAFEAEPYTHTEPSVLGALGNLALTDDYVWVFSGARVLRRRR